jgi:hypothetical protein
MSQKSTVTERKRHWRKCRYRHLTKHVDKAEAFEIVKSCRRVDQLRFWNARDYRRRRAASHPLLLAICIERPLRNTTKYNVGKCIPQYRSREPYQPPEEGEEESYDVMLDRMQEEWRNRLHTEDTAVTNWTRSHQLLVDTPLDWTPGDSNRIRTQMALFPRLQHLFSRDVILIVCEYIAVTG